MYRKVVLDIAQAALSPRFAWDYHETIRKTWPVLTQNPDELCQFYAKNPATQNLIWC